MIVYVWYRNKSYKKYFCPIKAYQRWLEENGNSNENLPGMNATGYQLFFLNFAQIWCGTMRPEAIRNKIKTDVHSPGRFRFVYVQQMLYFKLISSMLYFMLSLFAIHLEYSLKKYCITLRISYHWNVLTSIILI